MTKYSVVVPFHNEEENVTVLYARIKQVMEQTADSFELVLVDDGSTDRTYHLLEGIASVDSRVLIVKLRRNFGQTSALAAGFDQASGEFILALDGDLQHDPNDIPAFLEKLDEGYDIVSGWRRERIDSFLLRQLPSRCANWMMARLCGVPIHDFGTTFKAYRREVIRDIPLYGEMHRFIPALASLYGASICEVPIQNAHRERGHSHYGLGRTLRVVFDLLTIRFLLRHVTSPLHFFGGFGALCLLGGSAIAAALLAIKIRHPQLELFAMHGPVVVLGSVLILAGIQLLAIGLLGELQVHHHFSDRNTPYRIERLARLSPTDGRDAQKERGKGR